MQKQLEGTYYTGNYPNLFAEYGFSETEIQNKLTDTWNQMFHGHEETRIYYEAGDFGGYLLDTGNLDVRTEGMSYGMMMAVQLNRKDVFDRIWYWAHTHMLLRDGENAGYIEYAYYDGTSNDERGYGHFFSDSYRVAANIGLDAYWFGGSEWHSQTVHRIQTFFADKSPEDYRRYRIDGTPFEEKSLHPVGLIATNAMASLAAADSPHAKSCLELFWHTPVRTGERRYYDNCLYLFSMLALSGHFKIWLPK